MKMFEILSWIEDKKIEGIKRYRNFGTANEEEIKIYFNRSLNKIVKEINGAIVDGGLSLKIYGSDISSKWEIFNTYSNEEFDVITIVYLRKGKRMSIVYQDPGKKFSLQRLHMENQLDTSIMELVIGYNLFPSSDLASKIIFEASHKATEWKPSPEKNTEDKWIESITKKNKL